jgi:hypothetical protein
MGFLGKNCHLLDGVGAEGKVGSRGKALVVAIVDKISERCRCLTFRNFQVRLAAVAL